MNNQARSDRSLGDSTNNFMGVNFAELISRVLYLKQEWLGDLGSHLFPDKEQVRAGAGAGAGVWVRVLACWRASLCAYMYACMHAYVVR